ncbi:MAG TPA: hypothetical protein VK191_00740 [Symbiobacteriaceae bacterium]|nr:hypothetical protein [Symbiobacteriaceae bacterium]
MTSFLVIGWTGLLTLLGAAGALAWWLFQSPLTEAIPAPVQSARVLGQKSILLAAAALCILGAASGGIWDTAWHMRFGVPVQDFWWPPHITIYLFTFLDATVAGLALGRVLRQPGSIRARFRSEPFFGALSLFTATQLGFAPLDEVWHRIYGKELSGLSLPHLLIVFLQIPCLLLIAAAVRELQPKSRVATWLRLPLLFAMAAGLWALYGVCAGDWEFMLAQGRVPAIHPLWSRPAWSYLLLGLVPAAFFLGALTSVRGQRWTATTTAVIVNLWGYGLHLLLALAGNPLPFWVTPLGFVLGGLCMDLWRQRRGDAGAGVAFTVGHLAFMLPATLLWSRFVTLGPIDLAVVIVGGVLGGWLASSAGVRLGAWLTTASSNRLSQAV